jgi:sortase (surface protein transpeptidase)
MARKKLFVQFAVMAVLISVPVVYFHYNLSPNSIPELHEKVVTESGLPVRLAIPSIKVDASVEYAGLTKDGAMESPKNPEKVSWFASGTIPGHIGSAVIAGHYGWVAGRPVVFDNLSSLHKGETLSVLDDAGKRISFVVREIRVYDKDANVPEVFTSSSGAHLNLIACIGKWDASKKTYAQRLVVFTDLVP